MTKLLSSLSVALITSALVAQQPLRNATVHVPAEPLAGNYGRIPLSFEVNRGQTDSSVQFLAHGEGYMLYLRQDEALLALRRPNSNPQVHPQDGSTIGADELETSLIRVRLAGANTRAAVRPEDEQITKSNYFIGNDPAQWRTDVLNYGRIRYVGVYPGIDLIYYGNQRQLEHDFVVAPGADPGRIALTVKGAERLHIDRASGDLIVSRGQSELRLLKPVTYQGTHGQRMLVPSRYKLLAGNKIGFAVGRYDHARPLVIDPVLVYSTYLGGSPKFPDGYGDQGNGIAVDDRGNAYVVGTTLSADFPVTSGSLQNVNHTPGTTVFVTKLNATGTALVYSTYLGGSAYPAGTVNATGDFGYGIALDSEGHAYVTGATTATDFPVTRDAFQTKNASLTSGAPTAFVAKLDRDGDRLEYSTYLGGSGNQASPAQGDVAQAIAVNEHGDAYVTGYTWSPDFPVSEKAFQPHFAGSATVSNAFVTKLNHAGARLVYSTYLGGSGSNGAGDYGNAIAIDAAGDAFVTGSTGSVNFPVTSGAYQSQNNAALAGNGGTAFVTELNRRGESEVYSTYLGGSGGDSARAIAVDKHGAVYVAGVTASSDFPVTAGVLEGTNSGIAPYFSSAHPASFVTKLNQDGSALEYSTYLEGQSTSVSGLAVDSKGSVYLTGSASAAFAGTFDTFQETPDALSSHASTGSAPFLVKLDPSAAVLNYATLFGGSTSPYSDNALALALDTAGNVYVTGATFAADFPTTSGAFQTVNNGAPLSGDNAFISKFALASEANQTTYPAPSLLATSLTLSATFFDFECAGSGVYIFNLVFGARLTTADGGQPSATQNYEYLELDVDGYPSIYTGDAFTPFPSQNYDLLFTDSLPIVLNLSAYYAGDPIYAPASASGTFYGTTTTPCPSAQALSGGPVLAPRSGSSPSLLNSTPAKSGVPGQKFALPLAFAP